VRRRHCVGGGAPVNFGRRRRAGPKKSTVAAARRGAAFGANFFKFRYIVKTF